MEWLPNVPLLTPNVPYGNSITLWNTAASPLRIRGHSLHSIAQCRTHKSICNPSLCHCVCATWRAPSASVTALP